MSNRLKIRTPNPEALRDTLLQLVGGHHEVLLDTYVDGVVEVETTNPGFLAFAVEGQGYGQVVSDG